MGADTNSRAEAEAVRGLTGGLRFELAQAANIIQQETAATIDQLKICMISVILTSLLAILMTKIRKISVEDKINMEEHNSVLELLKTPVKQYGVAHEFASENIWRDGEIVMAAVKQKRYALEFASEDLILKLIWK